MDNLFGIDKDKYPMTGNPDYSYWGEKSVNRHTGRLFNKQQYIQRYQLHNHKMIDSVIEFYGKPNKVISVGCGLGWDVERLVQLGVDVVGLEITQEAIDNSTVKNYIVRGSAHDLSRFNDNEFDLVICFELMEHLPPELTEQAIGELRRIGTNRAVLTIGRGSGDPTHINLRPREEWIKLLAPMDNLLQQKISDSLKAKRLVDMVWDRVYVMRLDNESNNIGCG